MTGGRVKRIQHHIGNEPFMLTYGDGVSNVDIGRLVDYHKHHGKLATVTSVQPLGRFGALDLSSENAVKGFQEKPRGDGGWINGGFFVLQPEVFDYIENDDTVFERGPMEELAKYNELIAYKHDGFWQPMDTMRDKEYLEELWQRNKAPWKLWE
jgi:glucose-1-phosphate cytidylyltransferase